MKEIQLTQGKVALVDDEDFERVNAHKWHTSAVKNGHTMLYYAHRDCLDEFGKLKKQKMHRFILGLTSNDGKLCDHINHNGLDNRKANLRIVNNSQNQFNKRHHVGKCNYKGVYSHNYKTFYAHITYMGKRMHIGTYNSQEDAAKAYDAKAIELFGDFACLNFPVEVAK